MSFSKISEPDKKKFDTFFSAVPELIKETQHSEMYGYCLDSGKPEYNADIAQNIAYKFFKANKGDVELSKSQLKKSFEWRRDFNPLKAGFGEQHDLKFDAIGFITENKKSPANLKVVTWNLYGATGPGVKSPKDYFADFDKFVRWRIGLMEKAIALLDFCDETNNYIAQVHDYEGVSFLSTDASVKRATKQVVSIFQNNYPEFLSTKYFLNFPFILAWVYNSIVKNYFISEETVKKFHILHNGKNLVKEFEALEIPKKYGGDGKDLTDQNVKAVKCTAFASEFLVENEANEVD